jgi:DNA-binding transcriptional ArsR family regulator
MSGPRSIRVCLYGGMTEDLEPAAELFKALSSVSRLRLLRILAAGTSTVGQLADASGLSQPLVSQHLRTLRSAGLVSVERVGREAHYEVADVHVSHIVDDAVLHALEG